MASKTIRKAICAFLQGYQSFTSVAVFLVFPASASILLCQALNPSSSVFLRIIPVRLSLLFQVANFPASSKFFSLLSHKLTQTTCSYFFTLPFTFTFLLLAKASIVYIFRESPLRRRLGLPPLSSFLPLYRPILLTHLLNSFVILSANATVLTFFFLAFNATDLLGLSSRDNVIVLLISAAGAALYSIVIAYTTAICNVAIVVASIESRRGCMAILKAYLLIRGRVSTALALALSVNLGLAAAEALFQYRVVRQYNISRKLSSSLLWEGFSIAYFHAILLVLEAIISCVFYNSCTVKHQHDLENRDKNQREIKPEKTDSFICIQLLEEF